LRASSLLASGRSSHTFQYTLPPPANHRVRVLYTDCDVTLDLLQVSKCDLSGTDTVTNTILFPPTTLLQLKQMYFTLVTCTCENVAPNHVTSIYAKRVWKNGRTEAIRHESVVPKTHLCGPVCHRSLALLGALGSASKRGTNFMYLIDENMRLTLRTFNSGFERTTKPSLATNITLTQVCHQQHNHSHHQSHYRHH
jgi:hypothetical protein